MSHIIEAAIVAMAILSAPHSATAKTESANDKAVTLVIRFHTSVEGDAEFRNIMNGINEAMATEEGFISARVFRNLDDAHGYVLQEEWSSRHLHQEHYVRIVEAGDWAHIKSLLTEEPVMEYIEPLE